MTVSSSYELNSEADNAVHLSRVWSEFCSRFKAEEDCVELLRQPFFSEDTRRCRHCGSDALVREYGQRVGRCRSCRRKVWITAGTFFQYKTG